MPPLGIRTVIDGKLVAQGLQNLSKEIPKIGRNQIYQVFVRSLKKLRKPGKRPTYPIPWVSIRQKIKVLILLKHVLGIPYKRTGLYQKQFVINRLGNSGYELVNQSERATYIGGDADGAGQTRPFVGRYPIVRKVVDTEFKKLPSAVVQHIVLVAKEQGFDATVEE